MCGNNYLQFCQLWKWHFISLPFCWSILTNLISLFTLKALRHSTFLRFLLKNYLLFFAVFPDTKNAPQILFFTNFFHIMPKLINFNHNYIKLNNCCYNSYKMFIMLNMAFKCDQKSSCDVWWRSFDLNMGYYYHTTTMCRQQLLLWLLSTHRTVSSKITVPVQLSPHLNVLFQWYLTLKN